MDAGACGPGDFFLGVGGGWNWVSVVVLAMAWLVPMLVLGVLGHCVV